MGYLLIWLYSVKEKSLIDAKYVGSTCLIMILFLIPLLDLIVYNSMKSYARELSNAGGKREGGES